MTVTIHTPDELRALLVEIITGVAGGDAERWREAIGEVHKLPIASNVRSNWRVRPTGNETELGVIKRATDLVRGAHPYVAG